MQWDGDGRASPHVEQQLYASGRMMLRPTSDHDHLRGYDLNRPKQHLASPAMPLHSSPPPPLAPSSPGTRCLAAAASNFFGGEAELLKKAFDKFDARRSGQLDYHETLQALRHLGFDLSNSYRRAVFGHHSVAGRVSLAQFVSVARGCAEAADDGLRHESCYNYLVRICTGGLIWLEDAPAEYYASDIMPHALSSNYNALSYRLGV